MRKELHCPQIIKDGKTIGYGGDQEWFPGDFQRLAGCGSTLLSASLSPDS